jgi:hypothetical protein
MSMLRDALSALSHAARRSRLAAAVFAAEDGGVDFAAMLATTMLQNRDNEVCHTLQR